LVLVVAEEAQDMFQDLEVGNKEYLALEVDIEREVEYRDLFVDLEVDNKEYLALEVDIEPFLSILE
jgi:hypothetical protein